jgi:hypothetical protein
MYGHMVTIREQLYLVLSITTPNRCRICSRRLSPTSQHRLGREAPVLLGQGLCSCRALPVPGVSVPSGRAGGCQSMESGTSRSLRSFKFGFGASESGGARWFRFGCCTSSVSDTSKSLRSPRFGFGASESGRARRFWSIGCQSMGSGTSKSERTCRFTERGVSNLPERDRVECSCWFCFGAGRPRLFVLLFCRAGNRSGAGRSRRFMWLCRAGDRSR